MAGTDRSKTFTPSSAPAVVLVAPQMGENIGATARAMLNFAMTDLRLVSPRDGWPNPQAEAMASGAVLVLEKARLFDTLADATADLTYLAATTARPRDMLKPVLTPEDAAGDAAARLSRGERPGFVFGPERAGLSSEDIALCDAVVEIPTNPAFASLNLSQAVLACAYEWGKTLLRNPSESRLSEATPASKSDVYGLFDHLERALDRARYFFPPEKAPGMRRNLRTMLGRAGFTEPEIRTLRGVVKALDQYGGRNGGPGEAEDGG